MIYWVAMMGNGSCKETQTGNKHTTGRGMGERTNHAGWAGMVTLECGGNAG